MGHNLSIICIIVLATSLRLLVWANLRRAIFVVVKIVHKISAVSTDTSLSYQLAVIMPNVEDFSGAPVFPIPSKKTTPVQPDSNIRLVLRQILINKITLAYNRLPGKIAPSALEDNTVEELFDKENGEP